jgi:predicted transcriptional regulator
VSDVNRTDMRCLSSLIFNNDKFVEVVLALAGWDAPTVTTQQLARQLRINHDLVKKVLTRLAAANLVKTQERVGGKRGALPYEIQPQPAWDALVDLAGTLAAGDVGWRTAE